MWINSFLCIFIHMQLSRGQPQFSTLHTTMDTERVTSSSISESEDPVGKKKTTEGFYQEKHSPPLFPVYTCFISSSQDLPPPTHMAYEVNEYVAIHYL